MQAACLTIGGVREIKWDTVESGTSGLEGAYENDKKFQLAPNSKNQKTRNNFFVYFFCKLLLISSYIVRVQLD